MNKIIVTIGREYGSGGRMIGRKLAEKLDIPFYDRELIALSARDSGINEKVIEGLDETTSNMFFYALPTSDFMPSGISTSFDLTMNDRLFLMQSKVIKKIADEGSAVIVGRCADYVLRDYKHVINVYIYASLEERIKRAVKYYGISQSIAKKSVLKTDESRAKYYSYYTNRKRGIANNYSLCINSDIGIDEVTEILALTAKLKMSR